MQNISKNACSSQTVIIRPATHSDIVELLALLEVLFSIEADFVFDSEKQTSGLEMLLSSKKDCALVAESLTDNRVIVFCTVQTLISTAEGGLVGLLEDLVVDGNLRGLGVGTKLLDAALDWAGNNGLKRLQLLADKHNQPALAFYKKHGFDTTQLICLRHLYIIPQDSIVS